MSLFDPFNNIPIQQYDPTILYSDLLCLFHHRKQLFMQVRNHECQMVMDQAEDLVYKGEERGGFQIIVKDIEDLGFSLFYMGWIERLEDQILEGAVQVQDGVSMVQVLACDQNCSHCCHFAIVWLVCCLTIPANESNAKEQLILIFR
ncbi:hypothetical protein FGO68_gene11565 [Halteria grandinella]|uniref:Uncharacterized protein n=1 Tax=Halteria grandinella TaxID=5974 RepID=A0A8J8T2U4_HALGN|nr:hypothetical protein FGO68_gene11565 [Halteria grandinella]